MDNETFDLTLSAFTYGGDTLGRIPPAEPGKPDRAVFVPFGIPGERVRIRLVEQKRGFARGELLEVLEPAPERIAPRCKHFGACGGCHYQHMPYEMQAKAKTEILRDQLRRIGHIENAPVRDAVPSPEPYYYRNQVQFHLTAEGKLGYVRAGMIERAADESHRHRTMPSVIPISECHLPESAINSLWPQLEFEPGMNIERVSIRRGKDDELLVGLESDAPELPELEIEAGVSVAHIYEEHAAVLAGGDDVTMQVLGRDFRVSAASFFQVNTVMAGKMVEHVLANLAVAHSTILDVYCGVGLFSAFLAAKCERLIGIESSEAACEDFAVNLDEFGNVELYEDAAENVLPALDMQPDIILVDPPRAGLQTEALDAIVKMKPGSVIYVSCDPSTLARDASRLLKGGYRLNSVTPFDLFPQTYHIESISWFEGE